MFKKTFSLFLFALTNILIVVKAQDPEVVGLSVLLNAGLTKPYMNNKLTNVPEDFFEKFGSDLLPIGMTDSYDFGQSIKDSYSFLSSYDQMEVSSLSVSWPSHIQSLSTFLGAIYQPNADQEWATGEPLEDWYPTPVYTAPSGKDMLHHSLEKCPRLEQIQGERFEKEDAMMFLEKNKEFLTKLKELTKIDVVEMPWLVNQIYTELMTVRALTPQNAQDPIPEDLANEYENIQKFSNEFWNYTIPNAEAAGLYAGNILYKLLKALKMKSGSSMGDNMMMEGMDDMDEMEKKMMMQNKFAVLSADPLIIAAMERLFMPMGAVLSEPQPSSAFIIEIRKDADGKMYVKVLFKNTMPGATDLTPVVCKIPGCDDEEICPIDKFLESMMKKSLKKPLMKACKKKTVLDWIWELFFGSSWS